MDATAAKATTARISTYRDTVTSDSHRPGASETPSTKAAVRILLIAWYIHQKEATRWMNK